MRKSLWLWGLILLITGCSLFRDPGTKEITKAADGAKVYLICSDLCSAQGQCGTTVENDTTKTVVLVNSNGPATQNHNLFVGGNSEAKVMTSSQQQLERAGAPSQTWYYYRVSYAVNGQNTEGWVSGSCVSDSPKN